MSKARILSKNDSQASTIAGAALGTAAIGTSTSYARADHVHAAPTTITGNAGTATTLQTARTINGVAFNGSANITIADATKAPLTGTGASGTWGISISGNAGTATNVAYTGLTGTVPTWNQNTSGNAATATKLATARTINGVAFDGTANITVPASAINLLDDPNPLPTGSLAAGTVQERMEDIFRSQGGLESALNSHESFGNHWAATINNIPEGGISAINVQAAINELDSEKFPKTGGDIGGNLNFTGDARRIRFPFVGTPVGNRMLFQSSTVDAATYIGVIPNGTGRSAGITFSNSSDPDNAGYGYIHMSDAEMLITSATALGTGGTGGLPGAVPLVLVGRGASMVIGDGSIKANCVLGYGAGAGGTVTQTTSKSTAVTLNKACGQITMHSESMGTGAVGFTLNNSLLGAADGVLVSPTGPFTNYGVEVAYYPTTTSVVLRVHNFDVPRSDPLVINFMLIKGSTS